jgi:hypothetical protein
MFDHGVENQVATISRHCAGISARYLRHGIPASKGGPIPTEQQPLVYLPLELCFESTTWSGTVYALLEQHRDVQRDTYIHCIMKLESKIP